MMRALQLGRDLAARRILEVRGRNKYLGPSIAVKTLKCQ